MDRPQIILQLAGKDVSPESVDVEDLLTLLGHVRKAVADSSQMAGERGGPNDGPFLSLIAVEPGSCRLRLSLSSAAAAATLLVAACVSAGDYQRLPRQAVESLSSLSGLLKKRRWSLNVSPERGLDFAPVT